MARCGWALAALWSLATLNLVTGDARPVVWTVEAMRSQAEVVPGGLAEYVRERDELLAERDRLYVAVEALSLELEFYQLAEENLSLRDKLARVLGADHPTLTTHTGEPVALPSGDGNSAPQDHCDGTECGTMHEEAVGLYKNDDTIDCSLVQYIDQPSCGQNLQPATTAEVSACAADLCAQLPKWGIANGEGASLMGEGYGYAKKKCEVRSELHPDGGEMICTATKGAVRGVEVKETIEMSLRQLKVKDMFRHAWKGYAAHAWGENELSPVSRRGVSGGIFGAKMGASIVDALDTMIIMGFTDELEQARAWVDESLTFDGDSTVSVFESTIRFVGGLLSAYALSADPLYKEKAVELADRLLPAFNTPTGVPLGTVNLISGVTANWGWAPGRAAILSEFGSLQLEFAYLSDVTGNPVYREKADRAMAAVLKPEGRPKDGTFPNFYNPNSGTWTSPSTTSMGAYGDSFYEYLLKTSIYSGESSRRKIYDEVILATAAKLHRRSGGEPGHLYIAEERNGHVELNVMYHLTCFAGGLYALSGLTTSNVTLENQYMRDAEDITRTCHESYRAQPSGLGPEAIRFGNNGILPDDKDGRYQLRPETIESYFYMWRTTHDPQYREWAWEAALAIEKHCKCGVGYCGIKDVNTAHPSGHDDVQQSFFLAETLKYLYLIFGDDDEFDLSEWVFNTEAHPFPINKSSK